MSSPGDLSSPAHISAVALIRHTSARIARGICYGRTDVPPGEGQRDAARIIRRVAFIRPRLIFSSPARRCHALALRAAAALGVELRTDARLLELDFGTWEGMRWNDVPRAALDLWAADPLAFAPPGGESGAELVARATAFFDEIRTADAPLAVISHAGPLRVLLALARGEPIDLLQRAPALGSCEIAYPSPVRAASTLSTTHSLACSAAPSTSPV